MFQLPKTRMIPLTGYFWDGCQRYTQRAVPLSRRKRIFMRVGGQDLEQIFVLALFIIAIYITCFLEIASLRQPVELIEST